MRLKKFNIQEKQAESQTDLPNIWVELSSPALENNVQEIKKVIDSNVMLMAMVKANAYGHGVNEIAPLLEEYGVNYFGVNSFKEAVEIRELNCNSPILILGKVNDNDLKLINGNHFELVAYSIDYLKKLNQIALEVNEKFLVHLKIDTGMGRLGILMEELPELIKLLPTLGGIEVKAIMTHFAESSDSKKKDYFDLQLRHFQEALFEMQKGNIQLPLKHTANSGATLFYPESHFDLVRVGAALYGFWPSRELKEKRGKDVRLQPVLTLKTKIVQIKTIKKGTFIGYGCTFEAPSDLKIAVLPIGYAESYSRLLSNQSEVLIHGKRAPVRGRISMNLTVVEISKIPEAKVGDEVILIGKEGNEEVTADELAEKAGTINYEILTRIPKEISRIVK